MICMDSRLRVARGLAKSETKASVAVFETLKARGHPDLPPPLISDGWGGIDEAMIEVYGKIPAYRGRGPRPKLKKPQPGWQYVKMVKQRQNGRVIGVDIRVVYGDETEVLAALGGSTAYVERTHLTMRQFNARLHRKTLAFSKNWHHHRAAATWEDLYYNLALPNKTLKIEAKNDPNRKWIKRTPAMAADLTDHIWTVKELLNTIALPGNT